MALVAILIQSASLFRNFPSNPACGRVLNVFANLNVLINCDSAVFMKDAQNPSRLFNGDSVYQDRPAHALFAWIMSNFLKVIGFPNSSQEIVGNSGESTIYQSAFYFSFLSLNLLILLVAIKLAIDYVFPDSHERKIFSNASSILLIVFLVAGNELTKTFFWTPHSQMLNLLLPVLALVLISNREKINSFRVFLSLTVGLVFLMFFYPLFGILFSILVYGPYSKFWKRTLIISTVLFGYLLYPRFLEYLGGSYSNYAISNFRQYVWIDDAFKQGNIFDRSISNLWSFLSTFPVIPTVLIFITVVLAFGIASTFGENRFRIISEAAPYLFFLAIYLTALFTMGFYARRLTLGPFIFLELFILRMGITLTGYHFTKLRLLAINSLLILLIISWVWTNGPLE